MRLIDKFDKMFYFREAELNDKEDIMSFIREFWQNDHILGNDEGFFLYEHGGKNNTLNFILAVDRVSGKIQSIQGFIPYSNDEKNLHICGVISKTHPESLVPFLGLETMKRMLMKLRPSSYCGIGTNPKTMLPLVKKFLKRHVGVMSHYYMLNPNFSEFKVADPDPKEVTSLIFENKQFDQYNYKIVASFSEIKNDLLVLKRDDNLPFKSLDYIERRYFQNPVYTYQVIKVIDENTKAISILVTREIYCNQRLLLNWVDFIGEIDSILSMKKIFQKLIFEKNYEYVDCLCDGVDERIFKEINFKKKNHEGTTIIPTYFEPFIKKNVKIHFEKSSSELIIFKGDADGDRPSKSTF